MDENEFKKSIEDIVLYPGSLDELNMAGEQKYQILPLEGPQKYIIGMFIPDFSEVGSIFSQTMEGLAYMAMKIEEPALLEDSEMASRMIKELIKEEFGEGIDNLMPGLDILKEVLLYMAEEDIRIKAKKLGASGLIRLEFLNESKISFKEGMSPIRGIDSVTIPYYSGVPVYK